MWIPMVLLIVCFILGAPTALSQGSKQKKGSPQKARPKWVCKVYDNGHVRCRDYSAFVATAQRARISAELIRRTQQLRRRINPRDIGKDLSVVQCLGGAAQLTYLGASLRTEAVSFCSTALDDLLEQLRQSSPQFIGAQSLLAGAGSSTGTSCGYSGQGGIAQGQEIAIGIAIEVGANLINKYIVENLTEEDSSSASSGGVQPGHQEDHQRVSFADSSGVTDVQTDWTKDTSVTTNSNGSKTTTEVERTTVTKTSTDRTGSTTKTVETTETKTVTNPDGSKTVETTKTTTVETSSETTESTEGETVEYNSDGTVKKKTPKKPTKKTTPKPKPEPSQCGQDFGCSSTCQERQAAWQSMIDGCARRNWSTYNCKSIIAAANGCPDPATVMPSPDGDYRCGRRISTADIARLRKEWCTKKQGIMSTDSSGSQICTVTYKGRQSPRRGGFDPCSDPRAKPTPEGCSVGLIIPTVRPAVPVPKPPEPQPHPRKR